MKTIAALGCAVIITIVAWAMVDLSPLFLNSKILRIHEKDLPSIRVEKNSVVYCRMKADDFRFPLPPGARAASPVVTGGFDTVHGSVEARFDGTNAMTALEYRNFLSGSVPIGGNVDVHDTAYGLLIKFRYFGDK